MKNNFFIFLPIAGLKDKNIEDFMLNNEKIIATEARSAIDNYVHLFLSDESLLIINVVEFIMSNLKLKDDYLIYLKQKENQLKIHSIIVSAIWQEDLSSNFLKMNLSDLSDNDVEFLQRFKQNSLFYPNDFEKMYKLVMQNDCFKRFFNCLNLIFKQCFDDFTNRYNKFIDFKKNGIIIFTEGDEYFNDKKRFFVNKIATIY
ncbi:hypothetical protein COBT_002090 [Conglomerata obtusa]